MLLLVFGTVMGQDETADAAEGAAVEGKSGEGGDEEAWQYVEFLKTDVK